MNMETFVLVLLALFAAMYVATVWAIMHIVKTWLKTKVAHAHLEQRGTQMAAVQRTMRDRSPFPFSSVGPRSRNEDPDLQ